MYKSALSFLFYCLLDSIHCIFNCILHSAISIYEKSEKMTGRLRNEEVID